VEFVGRETRPGYLRYFHRIDISLDTLPYNGHTTTLDSLWMGVPVISQVGRTVVGRAGVSQLSNLGLAEFVARTEGEYVEIAARLAGDLSRLVELRGGLREKMRSSPLVDAGKFATDIESAFREIWQEYCRSSGGI
jgi:predicted O-linked N-acetylglucosamine transferase (SPINDLY family)